CHRGSAASAQGVQEWMGVPFARMKWTEKYPAEILPRRRFFSLPAAVGRRRLRGPRVGGCRAFRNSSGDSCRSTWRLHSPRIGGYPRELCFTRDLPELYVPTIGTGGADRIDARDAGVDRARQCAPVGERQYGHRIGVAERAI